MGNFNRLWSNGNGNAIKIFLAVAAAIWAVLWGAVKIGWIASEKNMSFANRLLQVEKAECALQETDKLLTSADKDVKDKLDTININLVRLCQNAGVKYER